MNRVVVWRAAMTAAMLEVGVSVTWEQCPTCHIADGAIANLKPAHWAEAEKAIELCQALLGDHPHAVCCTDTGVY